MGMTTTRPFLAIVVFTIRFSVANVSTLSQYFGCCMIFDDCSESLTEGRRSLMLSMMTVSVMILQLSSWSNDGVIGEASPAWASSSWMGSMLFIRSFSVVIFFSCDTCFFSPCKVLQR